MPDWHNQPWQRNTGKTASGKPVAVHSGAMITLLTLASGPGYAAVGAGIFWAMTGLCTVVVVLVGVGGILRRS